MRKIAKVDVDYAHILKKIAKLNEKNSQDPLSLTVINILVNKKWYSQRKLYFPKGEIAAEVITGIEGGIDKYKIDNIGEILNWLVKEGWIEENHSDNEILSGYMVSDLGNALIKFLIQAQSLTKP